MNSLHQSQSTCLLCTALNFEQNRIKKDSTEFARLLVEALKEAHAKIYPVFLFEQTLLSYFLKNRNNKTAFIHLMNWVRQGNLHLISRPEILIFDSDLHNNYIKQNIIETSGCDCPFFTLMHQNFSPKLGDKQMLLA